MDSFFWMDVEDLAKFALEKLGNPPVDPTCSLEAQCGCEEEVETKALACRARRVLEICQKRRQSCTGTKLPANTAELLEVAEAFADKA